MAGPTRTTHLHFARLLLPDGWGEDVRVGIAAGRIATVERGVAARPGDERHAIGLPGVPNLHSHAFQRGMAGLAEIQGPSADSFWTWREAMYRFVDRIDPDDLQAIAALAYVEMLETGFTRVGEFHYLHHDRDGRRYADRATMSAAIAQAAAEAGIALTLLPVFYAHGDFGGAEPGPAQRRFVHDLDDFARLLDEAEAALAPLPDALLGVAPHSLRAVTPGELLALASMRPNAPLHIHIAEQVREVENCLAWSGARPVAWLLDHAEVDRRWCLVHATHMTGAETAALARSAAVAGLCPITEANLGDGLFPARAFREQGGRYGIGSDSNVLIDMTEELRLLEYGQRLASRARNCLADGPGASTGLSLFQAAASGGAQALGGGGGRVAVGEPADLVSLDASHPSLDGKPTAQLLDAILFAAGRPAIDGVWRAGVRLVSGGRHHDRARVAERYRRTLAKIAAA